MRKRVLCMILIAALLTPVCAAPAETYTFPYGDMVEGFTLDWIRSEEDDPRVNSFAASLLMLSGGFCDERLERLVKDFDKWYVDGYLVQTETDMGNWLCYIVVLESEVWWIATDIVTGEMSVEKVYENGEAFTQQTAREYLSRYFSVHVIYYYLEINYAYLYEYLSDWISQLYQHATVTFDDAEGTGDSQWFRYGVALVEEHRIILRVVFDIAPIDDTLTYTFMVCDDGRIIIPSCYTTDMCCYADIAFTENGVHYVYLFYLRNGKPKMARMTIVVTQLQCSHKTEMQITEETYSPLPETGRHSRTATFHERCACGEVDNTYTETFEEACLYEETVSPEHTPDGHYSTKVCTKCGNTVSEYRAAAGCELCRGLYTEIVCLQNADLTAEQPCILHAKVENPDVSCYWQPSAANSCADPADSADFRFLPEEPGNYTVRLTVSDGEASAETGIPVHICDYEIRTQSEHPHGEVKVCRTCSNMISGTQGTPQDDCFFCRGAAAADSAAILEMAEDPARFIPKNVFDAENIRHVYFVPNRAGGMMAVLEDINGSAVAYASFSDNGQTRKTLTFLTPEELRTLWEDGRAVLTDDSGKKLEAGGFEDPYDLQTVRNYSAGEQIDILKRMLILYADAADQKLYDTYFKEFNETEVCFLTNCYGYDTDEFGQLLKDYAGMEHADFDFETMFYQLGFSGPMKKDAEGSSDEYALVSRYRDNHQDMFFIFRAPESAKGKHYRLVVEASDGSIVSDETDETDIVYSEGELILAIERSDLYKEQTIYYVRLYVDDVLVVEESFVYGIPSDASYALSLENADTEDPFTGGSLTYSLEASLTGYGLHPDTAAEMVDVLSQADEVYRDLYLYSFPYYSWQEKPMGDTSLNDAQRYLFDTETGTIDSMYEKLVSIPEEIFFHESGHALDYNARKGGKYYSETSRMKKLVEEDVEDGLNELLREYCSENSITIEKPEKIVKNLMKGKQPEGGDLYSQFVEWANRKLNDDVNPYFQQVNPNTVMVLDMYSAVTGYVIAPETVAGGHGADYWKDRANMIPVEGFAEFFSAQMQKNDTARKLNQEYFPKTCAAMEDMAEDLLEDYKNRFEEEEFEFYHK